MPRRFMILVNCCVFGYSVLSQYSLVIPYLDFKVLYKCCITLALMLIVKPFKGSQHGNYMYQISDHVGA